MAGKHDLARPHGYGVRIVEHPTSEPPTRPRRGTAVALGILVLLALALVVAAFVQVDEYAITPGYSQPVGPLIKVIDHPHDATRRNILLTDVYLSRLSALQWLWDTIHPVHVQLIPGSELSGPDVPTSELQAQGYLEMYDSQNYAKVAGMRALHLDVRGSHAGATVTAVTTAASGTLNVADRIVGARGHAVTDVCSLVIALHGAVPGTSVTLKVQRATISQSGSISYATATTISVPTAAVPRGDTQSGCPGAKPRTVWLGISLEDAIQWAFPVSVTINTANIGGPSAGLAMTLGVIDALSNGSLTGHVRIAATGTIDPSGNVGDVGGVAEKTIAVETAGATVFLVPPQELGVAQAAASGGLKVIAVATLDQALAAIKRAGGTTPVPITGPVTTGATS
ncbi:MAG TPA: S16 family serine protease [Acidimicrobiales bacterium]|jgi:PDZ domain-containing protein